MILHVILKSFIHFESILVYGGLVLFVFFHVDTQRIFLNVFLPWGNICNFDTLLFHMLLVTQTNVAMTVANPSLFLLLKDQPIVCFYFLLLSSDLRSIVYLD